MQKNTKYVDLSYIEDISEGDINTKIQLIELFFDQVEEIKNRFAKAFEENNIEEICHTAHLAKSSTKVMGIHDISEKMQTLEQNTQKGQNPESYRELADYLVTNISNPIAELKQILQELKSID